MEKLNIDKLASFAKEKGFILPSSTIYGGFKGAFDYGPLGCQMKHNILEEYWNYFLIPHDNIVSQDGSILTKPIVWSASGHLENFNDPVAITTENKRVRADHLIENNADKLPPSFKNENLESMNCKQLFEIIQKYNITYNQEKIQTVENANLMFSTKTINGTDCYLRPETCQNIFINAKLIAHLSRLQLPFGICQHGKVFRNEISPKNFIFRCREFEQLELEFFYNPRSNILPNDKNEPVENVQIHCLFANQEEELISSMDLVEKSNIHIWHGYWITKMLNWLIFELGLSVNNLRLREHHPDELSHYSSATFDIEYKYPFGKHKVFKELAGIANRGTYDIQQHAKHSRKNLKFKCPDTKDKLYPHVIEPSIGVERLFLALLCDAYEFDKERNYEVLHFKPNLCAVEYAIFPLPSNNYPKQEFYDTAKHIQRKLRKKHIRTFYDQSGSIGRRYARQDSIGTKWCVTVDDITLENNTITVRDRDTKLQRRIDIEELIQI